MILRDAFSRFFFPLPISRVSGATLSDNNSAMASFSDISELGKAGVRKILSLVIKHEKNYQRLKHDISNLENVSPKDLWFELAHLGGSLGDSHDELLLMPHQLVLFLERNGYTVTSEQQECIERRLKLLSFNAAQFEEFINPIDIDSIANN